MVVVEWIKKLIHKDIIEHKESKNTENEVENIIYLTFNCSLEIRSILTCNTFLQQEKRFYYQSPYHSCCTIS